MKVAIVVLCFGLASCSILHKSTDDVYDYAGPSMSDSLSDVSTKERTKRNTPAAIQPMILDYPMLRQCRERHANAIEIIENAHGKVAECMKVELSNFLLSMGGQRHGCSNIVDTMSGCTDSFLDDLSPCMGTEVKGAMKTYLRGAVQATCENKEVLTAKFFNVASCLDKAKEQNKCERPNIDFYSKWDSKSCSELNSGLECLIAQYKICGEDITDLMNKILIEPMQQLSCNDEITEIIHNNLHLEDVND